MTKSTSSVTRSLDVDCVTTLEEAELLADEWNDLASGVRASPFALPALALPWWRHLGKGRLRIVTARSGGGELVGLVACHDRRFGGLDIVRPIGHGLGAIASTLTVPVKADLGSAMLAQVMSGPRTVLHLGDVGLTDPLVAAARRGDQSTRFVLHDECPVIELAGLTSVDDLLARPSHRGLRKALARADRSMDTRQVRVDVATDAAEVLAAFDDVADLYDASEEDRPRLHLGQGANGPFFRQALAELARRSQVAFLTLFIGGEPAAFDVYVVNGTVGSAILGRFHPVHRKSSPGHLLLRAAVDWAITTGLSELDLQLGSDQYKTRWATRSDDTFEAVVSEPRLARAAPLVLSGVETAHRLVGRVKRLRP